MADYAHPETLVSTDWVAEHLTDPKVRIVEVDVDTKSYDEGACPERHRLGVEYAAKRHGPPRHSVQAAVRGVDVRFGHRQRYHSGDLRRQQ